MPFVALAVVRPVTKFVVQGTIMWGVGEYLKRKYSNQVITVTVTPVTVAA